MTPEAAQLFQKLTVAATKLDAAKRFLEEVRKLGLEAEQQVVSLRAEVHSYKDQLAALAKEEGPK